uniref:Putative acid phosphatase n=1 Tax=Trypanosoma congolense (strain IL3000) TaxID=1068625 RepID=G0UWR3_TRYCI|nr:putative acid phosphatase [Trypanosoma congolense IL3000]
MGSDLLVFTMTALSLLRVTVGTTPLGSEEHVFESMDKPHRKRDLVLTKLIVLNRHGHRAPNAPYWTMCPNDRENRRAYNVDAEDLTALGMKEEFELGKYLRNKYRSFIGQRFNRSQHFLRAVGEPRILQSAQAVSQGLFPDGFGPQGYLPRQPQFVPVFSDMDTHEYLLDDVPCFRRAEADMRDWLNNSLDEFLSDPKVAKVLNYMKEVCGVSEKELPPLYVFLKTVADGMTFNSDFGLNVCRGKVTQEMMFKIRKVSLRLLMARLYHTDEQQTYTAVDLPYRILRMMNSSVPPEEGRGMTTQTRSKSPSSTLCTAKRCTLLGHSLALHSTCQGYHEGSYRWHRQSFGSVWSPRRCWKTVPLCPPTPTFALYCGRQMLERPLFPFRDVKHRTYAR